MSVATPEPVVTELTAAPELPPLEELLGRRSDARRSPTTATFTLRDLLVLTYAVPAEAVRPHVPESIALDMLPSVEGERMAFIQTTCAYHENARWSMLPEKAGGQSFHQITYRVLTRREGRRGAFALRTYVSSDEGRLAQRGISRDADFARFDIYIAGDPARATYDGYKLRAQGDVGRTQIDARALPTLNPMPFPFGSMGELASFLVDRPDNYFRASFPKTGIGVVTQDYGPLIAPFPPVALELTEAPRLTLWTGLDLLPANDPPKPYAALVFPSVTVTSHPPRFAKFKKDAPTPQPLPDRDDVIHQPLDPPTLTPPSDRKNFIQLPPPGQEPCDA